MNHDPADQHTVLAMRDMSPRLDIRPLQSPPLRTLDSVTLFRGAHEIGIEHKGSLYRLKITRQGKLILNK